MMITIATLAGDDCGEDRFHKREINRRENMVSSVSDFMD